MTSTSMEGNVRVKDVGNIFAFKEVLLDVNVVIEVERIGRAAHSMNEWMLQMHLIEAVYDRGFNADV